MARWLLGKGGSGWLKVRRRFDEAPVPTVTTSINVDGAPYVIYETAEPEKEPTAPAVEPSTLAQVLDVPPLGLSVVSTFSGCGGASLGLRSAGYRVLWASEFVPAAREVYMANFPGVPVDDRDVRAVSPAEILDATGLAVGELDVLEGSPPCASFSTAGKRTKGWGQVRHYSDTEQRVDDLFLEYVRLLGGLQPRAFVAENVVGLRVGAARGYLREIVRAMREAGPGYRVAVRELDAQWLGVPQQRKRLIFVGLRADVAGDAVPPHPSPFPWRRTIEDGLRGGGLPHERTPDHDPETGFAFTTMPKDLLYGWPSLVPPEAFDRPVRKFTLAELRRLCGFPDDFVLMGSYSRRWERLGRAVPPPMYQAVGATLAPLLADGR